MLQCRVDFDERRAGRAGDLQRRVESDGKSRLGRGRARGVSSSNSGSRLSDPCPTGLVASSVTPDALPAGTLINAPEGLLHDTDHEHSLLPHTEAKPVARAPTREATHKVCRDAPLRPRKTHLPLLLPPHPTQRRQAPLPPPPCANQCGAAAATTRHRAPATASLAKPMTHWEASCRAVPHDEVDATAAYPDTPAQRACAAGAGSKRWPGISHLAAPPA